MRFFVWRKVEKRTNMRYERSLQGAGSFLSRAGLFLWRASLFWPHQWIPRISPIQPPILHCQANKQSPLREWLFTTQRGSWEWDWPPSSGLPTRRMFSPPIFELQNLQYALWRLSMFSIKSTFQSCHPPDVSLMGQFSVKAPWIGLNRASRSGVGLSSWLFVS